MAAPRFTLRQLEIFAAVVRCGQINHAAATLHLSAAAVSQALRELAAALDLTLFERQGRRIIPTAAARQLLQLAAEPMASLSNIPLRLDPRGQDGALTGEVRLAASSTIARYVLPPALGILRQAHPELWIRVMSGNSAAAEAHICDLSADIGFIEGPPQRDDLAVAPWDTDRLQIIAPLEYDADSIRLDALDAHPWVLREAGSGTRAVFEQTLALAGYPAPRAQLIMDDTGAIVRAVAAGAGLACVSERAARANPGARLQKIDLPDLSLQRPLWRIQRQAPAYSPLITRFLTLLDETIARIPEHADNASHDLAL